ncbi:MAG: DUF4332 domain-containing protein [Cyanobacteriota bacterium]
MRTPRRGDGWEGLPAHFRHERASLARAGVATWDALAALSADRLRDLARHGQASEARLLRLRAQARLLAAADLAPEEASLLMHAGIADPLALATAQPEQVVVRVNRLWRRLLGDDAPPLTLATVRRWIQAAASSRSLN